MTFENFQNLARLYVIGALYPTEIARFEQAKSLFGRRAQDFIRECNALRDAFALSVQAPNTREALNERISRLRRPASSATAT